MGYVNSAIVSAVDEVARRRIESDGRLQDPWDAACGVETVAPSRTMEEWCEADEIDLLDGPLVLCLDPDFEGDDRTYWEAWS